MTAIQLSAKDVAWGEHVGLTRHLESVAKGRANAHGLSDDFGIGLEKHRNGACGELAFCRVRGLEWEASVGTFKDPDVDGIWQVRTRSEAWYDLIIRNDDAGNDLFVLVTGQRPHFTVHGYLLGREGKQPRFVRRYGGRPAAYFVPQNQLHRLPPPPLPPFAFPALDTRYPYAP